MASSVGNTVFLIDWDDTLMATTHMIKLGNVGRTPALRPPYLKSAYIELARQKALLTSPGCKLVNNNKTRKGKEEEEEDGDEARAVRTLRNSAAHDDEDFAVLDIRVCHFLRKCMQRGRIFLVTNSGLGWLEWTAVLFMPQTAALLAAHPTNMHIVRARVLYEPTYPGDSIMWKVAVFRDIVLPLLPMIKQVISIGDSVAERLALLSLFREVRANDAKFLLAKSLKLLEQPVCALLEHQVRLMTDTFERIVESVKCFDLEVTVEPSVAPNNQIISIRSCEPIDLLQHVQPLKAPPIRTATVSPRLTAPACTSTMLSHRRRLASAGERRHYQPPHPTSSRDLLHSCMQRDKSRSMQYRVPAWST